MHPDQFADIVNAVARETEEQYVFADKGAEIAALLRSRLAAGGYAAEHESALADQVTADLQSVNGDKHLRLRYHAVGVADDSDQAAWLAEQAVAAGLTAGGMARAECLPGNVGILEIRPVLYPPVLAGESLAAAMTLLARTDALLIDVRRCRGGSPDTVALLCGYLFGDEPVHLHDMLSRDPEDRHQYWSAPYAPGRRFGPTKPVYVLTSAASFSGAEDVAYTLQHHRSAVVVGERTGGGAHPRIGVNVAEHLEATIPVARTVDMVTGTNWEGTGVTPDVDVTAEQAFDEAYARALRSVADLASQPGRHEIAEDARLALARLTAVG